MFSGCYTALITPLAPDTSIDQAGLEKLVEFQVTEGIGGVLAVGTTGESPTLDWDEHNLVTDRVCALVKGRCRAIAGTGSNSTEESLKATEHAAHAGADTALLVDPYYNGPSSLEIRKEYVGPIAEAFPELQMIPYVIPGRSGCKLEPEDLALLHGEYKNVRTVKEATGDLDNMARTRTCCGDDFDILSGDDDKTYEMMTDERIGASGVISVMSNVAPGPITRFSAALNEGNREEADRLAAALKPLFGMVTVMSEADTPHGKTPVKARNPLPIKTLMNILGMPAGPCRRPLGKMNRAGLETVLGIARTVQSENPEIFAPIESAFGVDIAARLADSSVTEGLAYTD
ncbi:MAG: 4-hydroxy-tetrahydrodipicolinate synthase [Candidatus Latescibacteria bacterium]|jgi:4-hydroxy-tetrahydrodipicolinate synthase|nr:4-hydroxy-tetrahydrodipicolinate synthase [Candidatus Latescibacterota bacterium]